MSVHEFWFLIRKLIFEQIQRSNAWRMYSHENVHAENMYTMTEYNHFFLSFEVRWNFRLFKAQFRYNNNKKQTFFLLFLNISIVWKILIMTQTKLCKLTMKFTQYVLPYIINKSYFTKSRAYWKIYRGVV